MATFIALSNRKALTTFSHFCYGKVLPNVHNTPLINSTVSKPRRPTRRIVVGGLGMGGDEPVRVQSMTNTKTSDVAATVEQAYQLAKAGAELVRITTQSAKHAELLTEVKRGLAARGVEVPIIADIHFVPAVAFAALKTADKVRINPGNFLDSRVWKRRRYTDEEYHAELTQLEEKLTPFIEEAKKWKKPLRIGTNHGSLSDRILNRYGDTPLGMVEATLEYLRIFRAHGFEDIIVGLKASDAVTLIDANRLLVERLDAETMGYPIHLGVTEAGNGDEGRVKSTLGIAPLLLDGIGDTIRVSLTEDPVAEIPVAYAILQATHRRITRAEFISCPSCGRTYYDLETVTNAIKRRLGHLRGVRIGIMGCIVNGIGEMAGADFGYVGGAPGKINLFVGKDCVQRDVPEASAVDALIALIKAHGKWQEPRADARGTATFTVPQTAERLIRNNKGCSVTSMRILLAKPRGFCAGVDRAVDTVELALQLYGPPVYMRHHIVHNPTVVRALEAKGAVFVERTDEIPKGSVTVFSAHGVSPAVWDEARERDLTVIDATCPLVKKVHFEAKSFAAKGYTILLIGHRGHVEMEGTMGEAPDATTLIETKEEAETVVLPNPDKMIVLTQTTLSVDDTKETITVLKRRFPALQFPPKEDICYATTNRQGAVKTVAPWVQLFLMIGAPESSNTMRLVETARGFGVPALCIERASDIVPAWLDNVETVGVTAGASAPEHLVEEVLAWLKAHGADTVEEVESVVETMKFTLPPELVDKAKMSGKAEVLLAKHAVVR